MDDLKQQYDDAKAKAEAGGPTDENLKKDGDCLLPPGMYETHEEIVRVKEPLVPNLKKFDPRATLADISQDYVLFNHGALMLFAGLPFDPVQQHFIKHDIKEPPVGMLMDRPLFSGHEAHQMGKPFNHMVFAVPKEVWPELLKDLGTLTLVDRQNKVYVNVVPQKLPLLDVVALASRVTEPDKPPMVEVVVFALDGNRQCIHYTPALSPLTDVIKVVVDPPNPSVIAQADALFANKSPDISRPFQEWKPPEEDR